MARSLNQNRNEKLSRRKISETFLEFVEPLWTPLGADAAEAELEQALKIAFTVWNAMGWHL
ncbi:MAG TPA: hypothetical protein VFI31_27625 [Pirellulales bacterium]|nr:hypothetical protein [Pirellulales bacterium]